MKRMPLATAPLGRPRHDRIPGSYAGCDDKGPAETAGEKIDNAVESAGEMVEDAGDKIEDATDK